MSSEVSIVYECKTSPDQVHDPLGLITSALHCPLQTHEQRKYDASASLPKVLESVMGHRPSLERRLEDL
jgi:hypothetical protein